MSKTQRTFVMTLVAAFIFSVDGFLGGAWAQEKLFSNASLRGTYSFSGIWSGADEALPNVVAAGLVYFDGEGNLKNVFFVQNMPGEPDAVGNPTRDSIANLSDPSTWSAYGTTDPKGAYDVKPFGLFTFTLFNTLDGLPTRMETIEGVATITEFELFSRQPSSNTGGGVEVWHAQRIADGDILPPPEELEPQ